MNKVTDEQIREQIAVMQKEHPELKMCRTCWHNDRENGKCGLLGIKLSAGSYGCKHHITDEEYVIRETRKRLEDDAKRAEEHDKEQDWRLTLALDCMNASLRFLLDFETKAKEHYDQAVKGNDMAEAGVAKRELKFIKDMKFSFKKILEGIEQTQKYYDHYILPYLNNVFKKADGSFNERAYSDHESDGSEIANLALDWADCTYHNKENQLRILRFFEGLKRNGIMSEKSKKHYQFKR